MNRHVIQSREARGGDGRVDYVVDASSLSVHLEDAAHVPGGHAVALATPRDEVEVAAVLRDCARVLPIGAQSSLTGGATPRGDTLVSTARLRRMADLADGRLQVGAGVTIGEIDERLRRRGALYPPMPTWHGATIGGAIAANAAGAATFKYGTTRQWVDALTVVLPSGDVLDLQRGQTLAHDAGYFEIVMARQTVRVPVPRYTVPDVPKVSAGYYAAPQMDLVDLFVGAEGTLGIVTEATLRVLPRRPATCLAFVTFADRAAALACVSDLRAGAMRAWRREGEDGLDVSAIEHMDARSLALVREDGVDRRLGVTLDPGVAMGLLVAIDLSTGGAPGSEHAVARPDPEEDLPTRRVIARFAEVLDRHGVGDAILALPGDGASHERLLALREAVPLAVNRRVAAAQRDVDPRIEKTAADVIVPFEHFGALLELYEDEWRRRGLDGAIWGHISDGNVHPNVIPRSYADVESGREAIVEFGRAAIRFGGSPLAEHGVGRNATKQRLLRELYGEAGVREMRAVKAAIDPAWKLAPGVLLSEP